MGRCTQMQCSSMRNPTPFGNRTATSPKIHWIDSKPKNLNVLDQAQSKARPQSDSNTQTLYQEQWAKMSGSRCSMLMQTYPRTLVTVIAAKSISTE